MKFFLVLGVMHGARSKIKFQAGQAICAAAVELRQLRSSLQKSTEHQEYVNGLILHAR